MAADVTKWTRACDPCQRAKVSKHTKSEYKSFKPPPAKFSEVHIDLVGPLYPCQGYRYILTAVDRFTRWAEAFPVPDMEAATCAATFLQGWIQRYGVPARLTSDRGAQFTGSLWAELMALLGTDHAMTAAYHPQSNGMVERFHRQLKSSLVAKLAGHAWVKELPVIMLGVHAALKEDLQASPAELVFGQTLRLPGTLFETPHPASPHEYLSTLRKTLAGHAFVPPNWHGNSGSNAVSRDLASCTHVYVRIDRVRPPLTPCYRGPYLVARRTEKNVVIINDKGDEDVLSIDRVKPAYALDATLAAEAGGSHGSPRPVTGYSRAGRPLRPPNRLATVAFARRMAAIHFPAYTAITSQPFDGPHVWFREEAGGALETTTAE